MKYTRLIAMTVLILLLISRALASDPASVTIARPDWTVADVLGCDDEGDGQYTYAGILYGTWASEGGSPHVVQIDVQGGTPYEFDQTYVLFKTGTSGGWLVNFEGFPGRNGELMRIRVRLYDNGTSAAVADTGYVYVNLFALGYYVWV